MADTNKLLGQAVLVVALSMVVQTVMYIGNLGVALDCSINSKCVWSIVGVIVMAILVIMSLIIAAKAMK